MANQCLISIITVCLNIEGRIEYTMRSVAEQLFDDYEHIVVDGASTDGTWEIIKRYERSNLFAYSEPDNGISDAFNKGVKKAKGKYLLFLNGGDSFVGNTTLAKVADELLRADEDIVTYSVESIAWNKYPLDERNGRALWEKSIVPHQGTFIRKDVFEKVGLYNIDYKVRMDFEFFKRCYSRGCSFKCVPRIICHYESGGVSDRNQYLSAKEGLSAKLLYDNTVGKSEYDEFRYIYEESSQSKKMDDIKNDIIFDLSVERKENQKLRKLYWLMDTWIQAIYNGKNIETFFEVNGYKNIAIYGYGKPAIQLENASKCTDIDIVYYIDQNKSNIPDDRLAFDWNDEWPEVDCIVVTPFYAYEGIQQAISEKNGYKVASIEEVIVYV